MQGGCTSNMGYYTRIHPKKIVWSNKTKFAMYHKMYNENELQTSWAYMFDYFKVHTSIKQIDPPVIGIDIIFPEEWGKMYEIDNFLPFIGQFIKSGEILEEGEENGDTTLWAFKDGKTFKSKAVYTYPDPDKPEPIPTI